MMGMPVVMYSMAEGRHLAETRKSQEALVGGKDDRVGQPGEPHSLRRGAAGGAVIGRGNPINCILRFTFLTTKKTLVRKQKGFRHFRKYSEPEYSWIWETTNPTKWMICVGLWKSIGEGIPGL